MEHLGLPIKRTDAVANQTRILEAALAVFAERGLDMEIGEIVGRADIAIGTLYRHFANREHLLRAILTYVLNDTLAQSRAAIAETTDDPCAALLALISVGLRAQQQYGRYPELRQIWTGHTCGLVPASTTVVSLESSLSSQSANLCRR